MLPLVDGRQEGWPAWSWIALAASVPLAIAFAAHQRRKAGRGGVPLLDPRVFASWPLRAGLLTQTAFWCQQAASYLVIGLYLQQGRGLSPLAAGAVFGELSSRRRAPVLLPVGNDGVRAGASLGACVSQHRVGLPHSGGNPEVGAQLARARGRLHRVMCMSLSDQMRAIPEVRPGATRHRWIHSDRVVNARPTRPQATGAAAKAPGET